MDLFFVAGEMSGDLHGASLISDLLRHNPNLQIGAVAGPRMRALPIVEFFPMEKLQVMGFLDVLAALPKLIRQFFAIRNQILGLNPKAVICIDYPGFNLRLERSLRKKGYRGKLIHSICPTVWAWGKKRIGHMERDLDLLLTLFPFEARCFEQTKLDVRYIGHPLVKAIPETEETKRDNVLALFPGSRQKEIERNLPLQIRVAQELVRQDPSLQVVVSVGHPSVSVPPEFQKTYEAYPLMQRARMALATSGTVALELALHNTPTVVHFAIRPFDQFLAQKIFRINLPFYALPNIVAGERVFPELFGSKLTENTLLKEALLLREDSGVFSRCKKLRKLLVMSEKEPSAAEIIMRSVAF